ncbi:hypothetical protein MUK42_34421 [Musa troglodytarum]|uniref:Uncharacterized protein n=1 Tax=Musa troglodytarum TaxID=320322 RepID=A0A9E7GIJ7_9LILI|nr:hypothetical protein MUK42_34421 [Musa troglodytarum]
MRELYRRSRMERCVKTKHYTGKGHGGPDVPPLWWATFHPKTSMACLSQSLLCITLCVAAVHCSLNRRETPRLQIHQLLQCIKSSPSLHHHKHLYHTYFCRHPMVNMEYLKFSKRSRWQQSGEFASLPLRRRHRYRH